MSVQEKIANVNAVLRKLSQDEDLQDDLKMAAVKTALDHWTGRRRLAPETAEKLQNNRRVVYVLQRLQMLQHVCREAGMPVPLDLMLSGAAELDSPVPDISTSGTNQATSPPSSSSSPSSSSPTTTLPLFLVFGSSSCTPVRFLTNFSRSMRACSCAALFTIFSL
eukprot:CAMPEP_0173183494 /NCGR_PEP_ID=MMETSP1141-20130122/8422_1 /TAXON_ID=483371 /ORGANISM="non described non described, Strain CCMP2298" /LENGTH=164 /DNA_ID=CAMNT_0014106701 /DNA_START=169 /DNA_END=663 /DNA_ORIENTATION=-